MRTESLDCPDSLMGPIFVAERSNFNRFWMENVESQSFLLFKQICLQLMNNNKVSLPPPPFGV